MDILLPFALILVAFYFLIIRPQRNRARAAAQLQARLAPGAQVMTTAGMYGTVTEVADDAVHLEISPGVTVRFAKAAVGRILTADTTDETTDDTDARRTDGTEDPVEGDGPIADEGARPGASTRARRPAASRPTPTRAAAAARATETGLTPAATVRRGNAPTYALQ